MKKLILTLIAAAAIFVATAQPDNDMNTTDKDVMVEMETTMGTVVLRLFNDTPAHKANFIKLVNEGYYDGLLFHRVINEFMVQAGDPNSRTASPGQMLGDGSPDYDIEAEILCPTHFHKRGALAAARESDDTNPQRASSGSQFYIVTGKVFNEGQMQQMDRRLRMEHEKDIANRLASEYRDTIMALRRDRNLVALRELQDELTLKVEAEMKANPGGLTKEQREAYMTIGGAPHLDGSYTVFGEVVEGMDVVDRIQQVEVDGMKRPVEDVRIIKMRIL